MNPKFIFSYVLRIAVSIIYIQTLYFKFTAHPDSVFIFKSLGVEPWGRVGLGIIELVISVIILVPKTKIIGMIGGFFIILGAIFSHLLVLGVDVKMDGGSLFLLAMIIFGLLCVLFVIHKEEVMNEVKKIRL